MVNDFGSAQKIGPLATAHKGNLRFLPHDVLSTSGATYCPKPAHDLETFVKVLTATLLPPCDVHRVPYEETAIKNFWEETEKVNAGNVVALLTPARACQYDALKQSVACLFPVV